MSHLDVSVTEMIGLGVLAFALGLGVVACGISLYNLIRYGRQKPPDDSTWTDPYIGF